MMIKIGRCVRTLFISTQHQRHSELLYYVRIHNVYTLMK